MDPILAEARDLRHAVCRLEQECRQWKIWLDDVETLTSFPQLNHEKNDLVRQSLVDRVREGLGGVYR